MGRRKKKKFIDRWWVKFLMVAAAIFLIGEAGMKIWSSEAVQTRFVYMWPYQNEILEYSSKNKIDPFLVAAVIKNESGFDTEGRIARRCRGADADYAGNRRMDCCADGA